MRRVWLLACGMAIGVLPGCITTPKTELPADLLDVNPPPPVRFEEEPSSPYDARNTPAAGNLQPTAATADVRFHHSGPTPPAPIQLPDAAAETGPAEARAKSDDPPEWFLAKSEAGVTGAIVPTRAEAPVKSEDPLLSLVRCFRERRGAEGLKRLEKFDAPSRAALTALLPMISQVWDGKVDQGTLAREMDKLARQLRPKAALEMQKMCYCRRVESYGVYEPLPPNHAFQAGVPTQPGDLVQVYVELRNFTNQKQGGYYETALASEMTIHSKGGELFWRQDRPAQLERSRSERQDCFLNCCFYIPPNMKPGDYVLSIQVRDETGLNGTKAPATRVAARSLDLHVRGPATAAR